MAELRVFHSHLELYPYEKGQCKPLEKMMSKWNGFTYVPFGLYLQNGILYLPRGLNTSLIAQYTGARISMEMRYDSYKKLTRGVMKFPPKSEYQKQAIDFLTGSDQFAYSKRYSQLGLNLPTGDGKTFATIAAILQYKMRAIIITHQDHIRQEWYNDFLTKTTVPEEDIYIIQGNDSMDAIMNGEINKEIYLVNHQTLHNYANLYGYYRLREFFQKIKVGIKVIDEADMFFENTLMLDYFSNCYKSIYVTATFGRGDPAEVRLYQNAFSSLVRFGEQAMQDENRRKHIICNILYFKSHPKWGIKPNVSTYKGFSAYKYIDYELFQEPEHTLEKVLYYILDKTKNMEGKTLILSPTKTSVEYFAEKASDYTGKEVGLIYSDNSKELNLLNREKEIISSTEKSTGRGVNIKQLRKLIVLNPVGNAFLMDQISGRLREYSSDMDTYMFYPVDMSLEESPRMLRRVMPALKKKCKEVNTLTLNI